MIISERKIVFDVGHGDVEQVDVDWVVSVAFEAGEEFALHPIG